MKHGYIPPSDKTPGQVQRIINHLPNRVDRDDTWREVLKELERTDPTHNAHHALKLGAVIAIGLLIGFAACAFLP